MALTDSLISAYEFEANGNDSHGTNHLTNNNGVTFVSGKVGNAASFSAASTQNFSTSSTDFNFATTDSFSIAAWLKPTNFTSHRSVADIGGGGNRKFFYLINITDGVLYRWSSQPMVLLVAGSWNFIVHTFQSDGTNHGSENAYLDGVQKIDLIDNSSLAVPAPDTVPMIIGDIVGGGFPYDGLIDQLLIWRRAITGAEVTALYNGGAGLSYAAMAPTTPIPVFIHLSGQMRTS